MIGILPDTYTVTTTIKRAGESFLFNVTEQLLSPMWFLGCLFCASILTGVIYSLKLHIARQYMNTAFIIWFIGWLLFWIGIRPQWCNSYIISTSLMASAFIILGIECRKYNWKFENAVLALGGFFIVCVLGKNAYLKVDFRGCRYSNVLLYFLAAISGTYFIMYMAVKISNKNMKLRCFLEFIGKRTIWILVLHPLCFKIIGLFQVYILGYSGKNLVSQQQVYAVGSWGGYMC